MTYIKIDSNFVEIDSLSKLLSLSEAQIEKLIDLGYAGPSSQEIDEASMEVNEVMSKIKLGAHLVSMGIPDEIRLKIYEAYLNGTQYEERLKSYFEGGVIEMSQYVNLMNW